MNVKNFKESNLINSITNTVLDCYKRPLYIAIENLVNENILYFLMLKDSNHDLIEEDLVNEIKEIDFIEYTKKIGNASSFFNQIKKFLDNNKCIVLRINLYYSKKFSYYYNYKHSPHNILVIDYDEISNEFIIIDEDPTKINDYRSSYNPYYIQRVAANDLRKMCVMLNKIEPSLKDYRYEAFVYFELKLKENIYRNINLNLILNIYYKIIYDLQENVENSEKKYILCIENFEKSLFDNIYGNINSIYPIPKELSILFEHRDWLYIQKSIFKIIFKDDNLNNKFDCVLNKFDVIKNYIAKRIFIGKYEFTNKVINYIKGISILEKELYLQILLKIKDDSIEEKIKKEIKSPNYFEQETNIERPLNFFYINLKKYYNSKCFMDQNNKNNIKDFIGNNEKILLEKNFSNRVITNNNYSFKFPFINNNSFDNIVCISNEILLNLRKSFKFITILGFSEWNDYNEEFKIIYNNRKIETINVKFYNCGYKINNAKKIFWEGKKVQINKNIYSNAFLFSNTYMLNEFLSIQKIKLPECPNIHIIAITLANIIN